MRADDAGYLADGCFLRGALQAAAVAAHLVPPEREFQPERGRLRVHAVRAPHDERVLVFVGALGDGLDERVHVREQYRGGVAQLQAGRGVPHVVGREAVVYPAPFRAEPIRDGVEERGHVVLRLRELLVQFRGIPRRPAYALHVLRWDDAEARPRLADRDLDGEPAVVLALVGPDLLHRLAGVAVDHGVACARAFGHTRACALSHTRARGRNPAAPGGRCRVRGRCPRAVRGRTPRRRARQGRRPRRRRPRRRRARRPCATLPAPCTCSCPATTRTTRRRTCTRTSWRRGRASAPCATPPPPRARRAAPRRSSRARGSRRPGGCRAPRSTRQARRSRGAVCALERTYVRLLLDGRGHLAERDLLVLGERYLAVGATLAHVTPVDDARLRHVRLEAFQQHLADVLHGGGVVEIAEDDHSAGRRSDSFSAGGAARGTAPPLP